MTLPRRAFLLGALAACSPRKQEPSEASGALSPPEHDLHDWAFTDAGGSARALVLVPRGAGPFPALDVQQAAAQMPRRALHRPGDEREGVVAELDAQGVVVDVVTAIPEQREQHRGGGLVEGPVVTGGQQQGDGALAVAGAREGERLEGDARHAASVVRANRETTMTSSHPSPHTRPETGRRRRGGVGSET